MRFRQLLASTCLKSKVDKTVRNTFRAWNAAVSTIKGWPGHRLKAGDSSDWRYTLPWATFPDSYRQDVELFVRRSENDWLEAGDALEPLHVRTQSNYSEALRRAASILVTLGCDPNSIKTLGDVVLPPQAKRILHFLAKRIGRTKGGHVGYMSLVLFMAARDHVRLGDSDLATLEKFVRNTAESRRGMSDQTWERLVQFDDPTLLRRLQHLPEELVRSVKKQPLTLRTAKIVRLALALEFHAFSRLPRRAFCQRHESGASLAARFLGGLARLV
jgi:hypothetical protein